MEYLDGTDLDALVREDGPQPPARVAQVLRQVASALVEAHGIGLIHRDIKPENVILCERGGIPDVAKVVDFGLVLALEPASGARLTQDNVVQGTPLYLSPEAIRAPDAVDARSDLYGLGAVGYYLVTGTHVFGGATTVEVCSHHLHSLPRAAVRAARAAGARRPRAAHPRLPREGPRATPGERGRAARRAAGPRRRRALGREGGPRVVGALAPRPRGAANGRHRSPLADPGRRLRPAGRGSLTPRRGDPAPGRLGAGNQDGSAIGTGGPGSRYPPANTRSDREARTAALPAGQACGLLHNSKWTVLSKRGTVDEEGLWSGSDPDSASVATRAPVWLGSLVLLSTLVAGPAQAATFRSTGRDDRPDSGIDGTCGRRGTAPLHAAGRHPGSVASVRPDTIDFNIAPAGPQTITIAGGPCRSSTSPSPSTAPRNRASRGTPIIELSAAACGGLRRAGPPGRLLRKHDPRARDQPLSHAGRYASLNSSKQRHRRQLPRHGPGGHRGLGTRAGRRLIEGQNQPRATRVGGTLPADRNVISGNSVDGVQIDGDGADNNFVQGNYIGVDVERHRGPGQRQPGRGDLPAARTTTRSAAPRPARAT